MNAITSLELLNKAELGDRNALFQIGKAALAKGRLGTAIGLLSYAANHGHTEAKKVLASLRY